MAPFDGIPRNHAVVFLWLVLGIASLYHGFTDPTPGLIFGVEESVWLGMGYIVTGIVFWYEFRSKRNGATSD